MSKAKIESGGLTFTWNQKCSCYQFNLPPVQTCPGVKERLKNPKSICNYCYAKYGRFGQDLRAQRILQKNWRTVRQNDFWELLDRFNGIFGELPADTKFFRWFSCGDIVNNELWAIIKHMASDFPDIRFWCPTQTEYAGYGENFVIRHTQSVIGLPAPAGGHTTLLPEQKSMKGHYVCPGECEGCRKCWQAWKPETRIAFPFHGSACLMAKFNKARRIHKF